MDIAERSYSIKYKTHILKGDVIPAEESAPQLVILHGAGNGTRDRFKPLRERLARAAVSSLAFDFVGHGETGGDMNASSLQSRVEQACVVIEGIGTKKPLCLLGSSMGGYTAVKLLEIYPVACLILFVPAMYHPAAYSVPFGDQFSRIIRKPESWAASDAWKILGDFRGRLLIVSAGLDDVIPQGVIQRIYDSATKASAREHYAVPQSPHLLIHYLSQNSLEFDKVTGLMLKYLAEIHSIDE